MMTPFTLGQKVRFKPHHPGDVWDTRPYWVHAYTLSEIRGNALAPIIFYTVSDAESPTQPQRLTPYTRPDQLHPWPEEGIV